MDHLLDSLRNDYPDLHFVKGRTSCWSPEDNTVTYGVDSALESIWALFHELGHALLQHTSYKTDVELLYKETMAWQKASQIAQNYKITIESDYIQDCLDTYRDWLSKRSACPTCKTKSLPQGDTQYVCFNCHTAWAVTPARHHRPYRRRVQAK